MRENGEKRPRSALFGKLLKGYREMLGLSQPKLAEQLPGEGEFGFNHSHISRMETGKRHPGPDVALDLQEALVVPPAEQVEFLLRAQYPDEEVDASLHHFRESVIEEVFPVIREAVIKELLEGIEVTLHVPDISSKVLKVD